MIFLGSDSFIKEKDKGLYPPEHVGEEDVAEIIPQVEPVVIKLSSTLDLHLFSPKEVSSLLDEFIHLSQKADTRLINIIHGKGTGALRRQVRNLLARDSRVASFYDAPPKSGGWGATVAELKPFQAEDGGEAESVEHSEKNN